MFMNYYFIQYILFENIINNGITNFHGKLLSIFLTNKCITVNITTKKREKITVLISNIIAILILSFQNA